jgi:hypothetical protein
MHRDSGDRLSAYEEFVSFEGSMVFDALSCRICLAVARSYAGDITIKTGFLGAVAQLSPIGGDKSSTTNMACRGRDIVVATKSRPTCFYLISC